MIKALVLVIISISIFFIAFAALMCCVVASKIDQSLEKIKKED